MYAVKIYCGYEFGWLWLNDSDEVEIMEFDNKDVAIKYGEAWKSGYSLWQFDETEKKYTICE